MKQWTIKSIKKCPKEGCNKKEELPGHASRAGSIILRASGRETREGSVELIFGVKITIYGTNNQITLQAQLKYNKLIFLFSFFFFSEPLTNAS